MSSTRTWLTRLTVSTTAGGMLLLGAPLVAGQVAAEAPATAVEEPLTLASAKPHRHKHKRPGRRIVHYTVRPGDTATGLAVRFHAWTDELMAMNHLGPHETLHVGEHLRIPVVIAAARKAKRHAHYRATHRRHHAKPHARPHKPHKPHARPHRAKHHRPVHHRPAHHRPHKAKPRYPDPSRAVVRAVIIRTARHWRVDPELALAVSWQESGWQMHHVSSAHAIGAMQVLPSTGRWMSDVVGRDLDLRDTQDNVTAGVALLSVLLGQAPYKKAIAGYYQGLSSVQLYGMYPSTKGYVRNVLALKKRLEHGWNPA